MCSSAPTSGWGLDLPNYLKDWVMKEPSENVSGLKIFLNQPVDEISLKRLGQGWSWFIE